MTRWDHVRAALLALVLLAHGIYALPIPQAVTAKKIKEEGFQRDVDQWIGIFATFELHPSRDQVEDGIVQVTSGLHSLHEDLKTPFAPVMDLVGANQSWALFASASTRPDRLEVSIRRAESDEWIPVMRRLDPCCTWREEMLEYRRIRGVWDGQNDAMRPGYKGLTAWIAERAFDDFPDATQVRVRLLREHAGLPWDPPNPGIDSKLERVHLRPPPP